LIYYFCTKKHLIKKGKVTPIKYVAICKKEGAVNQNLPFKIKKGYFFVRYKGEKVKYVEILIIWKCWRNTEN
jgi:hypothetical protein